MLLVFKVHQDRMGSPDQRDHEDLQVLPVLPALTVWLVLPVQLEGRDLQVRVDF